MKLRLKWMRNKYKNKNYKDSKLWLLMIFRKTEKYRDLRITMRQK